MGRMQWKRKQGKRTVVLVLVSTLELVVSDPVVVRVQLVVSVDSVELATDSV